jgi:O-antigen ligase
MDGGSTPTDGDPTWRLILSLGYLSVAFILAPYYRETLYVLRRNWFLAALVLLALFSFLWAETPALALRRAISALGATLLGVALAVRLSLEDQLRLLSWLFRIITLLSLACIVLLPSYGISDSVAREWRGIFDYKNALGFAMALSILVEWHLPAHTRFSNTLNRLAMLASAVLLFFSGSLTPTLALAGSLLIIEMYKLATQRLRIPRRATVLAALLMVSFGAMLLSVNNERITSALGRSSDLTGRTEIWSSVVSYILERPVLGYGYSGFWYGAFSQSSAVDLAMGTMIMYSHNGYLEILLNLGAVGFVLTLVFLGSGIKRAFYCSECNRSSMGLWPLAFLLFFVLQNFGECTILLQDLEWCVCVAVVVGTDRALFAPDAEQEGKLLLEPSEEFP